MIYVYKIYSIVYKICKVYKIYIIQWQAELIAKELIVNMRHPVIVVADRNCNISMSTVLYVGW